MTITMQQTDRLIEINGVPARIWEGKTGGGIPVVVLVTRICVLDGEPTAEFDKELAEQRQPTVLSAPFIDAQLVL